jgi:hypothetical protein
MRTVLGYRFLFTQSHNDNAHTEIPAVSTQLHRGAIAHGTPPYRRRSVCSSCSPRAGHGGQVVVARGHGKAGYANYWHGADRCSMTGMGVGPDP